MCANEGVKRIGAARGMATMSHMRPARCAERNEWHFLTVSLPPGRLFCGAMIQVVERAGKMLDAFTAEHAELTLTECAEATGLTKSSAHRLLTSLAEIEMVERYGTRWRLGP